MNEDTFNIQVRKFLKKVGISSQREQQTLNCQNSEKKASIMIAHECGFALGGRSKELILMMFWHKGPDWMIGRPGHNA